MTADMVPKSNYSVIPNSCPHKHYSRCGLPPFVPWPEPCCDDCCPVNLGEWGAWRATAMQHVEAFEFYTWLEIPYGGSLQTDFKEHPDVCRSCEYGIDYRGRSFCCKPVYWVGGRTHGVRDCSAHVRKAVGW
jgi:hypothetical protein